MRSVGRNRGCDCREYRDTVGAQVFVTTNVHEWGVRCYYVLVVWTDFRAEFTTLDDLDLQRRTLDSTHRRIPPYINPYANLRCPTQTPSAATLV